MKKKANFIPTASTVHEPLQSHKNLVCLPTGGGKARFDPIIRNWLFVVFFSIMAMSQLIAQSEKCLTVHVPPTASQNNQGQSANGPFLLRLYIHIIRSSNGTGGFSEEEAKAVVNQLNNDYFDHNIRFAVKCITYINNDIFYYDPEAILGAGFGQSDGLNLFLSNFVSFNFGKADVGGNEAVANCSSPANYTGIVSHEIGHSLSLLHTFGLTECSGDPDPDGLPGTPPDSGKYPTPVNGCENWASLGVVCNGDPLYINSPGPAILRNIMSYADNLCVNHFVPEQGDKMRNHIMASKSNMIINDGWITQNTTFTGADRFFDVDLIVPAPHTLTIESNVFMAAGKRIIVEPGAKLVINGSIGQNSSTKLSNWTAGNCANIPSGLWGGIELKPHPTDIPGRLTINGGRIEHAQNAIYFNQDNMPDLSPQPVVTVNDAYFVNNLNHVSFRGTGSKILASFNIKERNRFNRCYFGKDGNLSEPGFVKGIYLAFIHYNFFNNCHFEKEPTGIANQLPNSNFGLDVRDSHLWFTNSITESFGTGINIGTATTTISPLRVTGSVFTKNNWGVNVKPADVAVFTNNHFSIGNGSNQEQFGLRFINGTGFIVANNYFHGEHTQSILAKGIQINNTGENNNSIRSNTFDGGFLRFGIEVNGLNRSVNPQQSGQIGLSLLCNTFETTNTGGANDIRITGQVRTNQGRAGDPAGNVFSVPNNTFSILNGGGDVINYYYYDGEARQNPNNMGKQSAGINKIDDPLTSTCTPGFTNGGGSLVDLGGDFNAQDAALTTAKNNFNALIDGGNTLGLLNSVHAATALNAAQVLNSLSSLSPNLSAQVLGAAFNRSDIFSTQQRTDLLIANPDVIKSGDFMDMVINDDQPLSAIQGGAVEAARFNTSARTHLEAELGAMYQRRAEIINKAVDLIFSDTLNVVNYTLLRTWLLRHNTVDAAIMAGDTYLAEGNTAGWQQFVNVFSTAQYSIEGQTDFDNYITYRQILLDAATQSRQPDRLNTAEVNAVEAIATDNDRMLSRTAKNLLEWFYGYSFGEEGLQSGGGEDRSHNNTQNDASTKTDDWVKQYPNPAHEELIFERLDLGKHNERPPFLTILNSMGQKVTARSLVNNVTRLNLNTEGLNSGLYYFTLTSADKIVQSGKFIVR